MSVYSFLTQQVGDNTLDAYTADIAVSFVRIFASTQRDGDEPHLRPLEEPAAALMRSMDLSPDADSGFELLAHHLRFGNKLLWEQQYSAPYPGKPAVNNLSDALAYTRGFNLATAEGIAHFQQALHFAARNIESTVFTPQNPAFTAFSNALISAAMAHEPSIAHLSHSSIPTADAARSLTSVMAYPQLAYPQGFDFRDLFDVMDVRISSPTASGHRHQQFYGEDILLYLYDAALNTQPERGELRLPLSGVYSNSAYSGTPMTIPAVNQYFENDYRVAGDIPKPTLADIAIVQHLFARTADFIKNPPPHVQFLQPDFNTIQLPGQLERLQNHLQDLSREHGQAVSETLSARLSPSMNYPQALARWEDMHAPRHDIFVVCEDTAHTERRGRSNHALLKDLQHQPNVVFFKDHEQCMAYVEQLHTVQKAHPYQFSVQLSQVELRTIPTEDFWQLAALKRSMQKIPAEALRQMGPEQQLNLVKSMAAEQSIYLPAAFEQSLQSTLSHSIHDDHWGRVLAKSMQRVPLADRPAMMQEFVNNAAKIEEPDRRPTEDNPLPLSRPSLRPS